MAKKKPTITELRRKELERLKIRPVKKKNKYNPSDARKIKKEFDKYQNILNLDDDEFQTINVKSKIEQTILNGMGIPVTNTGRAFVDKKGYDDVKLNFNPHMNCRVLERSTSEKIIHTPLVEDNILELLKNVDKNDILPDDVAVTVQVGNSEFNESYDSYEKLHNYIRYAFKPNTDDYEALVENMELVYFI